MNKKKNNDLGKREKIMIATLFTVTLMTCLLKLNGLTNFKEIRHLYLEQTQIRAEIKQLDAVLANEQQLFASYMEISPDYQHNNKLIPLVDQQPSSIGNLEKLIFDSAGRLMAMRVNEKYDYGDYSAQNISIHINDLPAFPDDLLVQLEVFPQLLVIEQLEWQAGETEAGTISLSLNLYYLN